MQKSGSGDVHVIFVCSLTESGLRAVGAYPSEDAVASLVGLLEAREAEGQDPVTKSRWQRLRQTLLELGRNDDELRQGIEDADRSVAIYD